MVQVDVAHAVLAGRHVGLASSLVSLAAFPATLELLDLLRDHQVAHRAL